MTSSPYVLYKTLLLLRVISTRRCTPAGFKLTKVFVIDDFSAAKDFGKVFIIIIYCFYNYYYYYYYYYYYIIIIIYFYLVYTVIDVETQEGAIM